MHFGVTQIPSSCRRTVLASAAGHSSATRRYIPWYRRVRSEQSRRAALGPLWSERYCFPKLLSAGDILHAARVGFRGLQPVRRPGATGRT